jgi:hypothetical protein
MDAQNHEQLFMIGMHINWVIPIGAAKVQALVRSLRAAPFSGENSVIQRVIIEAVKLVINESILLELPHNLARLPFYRRLGFQAQALISNALLNRRKAKPGGKPTKSSPSQNPQKWCAFMHRQPTQKRELHLAYKLPDPVQPHRSDCKQYP